ncbi:adhesion G-protein coupled receptor G6-like, partial [Plectropomus leopardus]|uniref:adhesion G-protein coupled receptor G6-like n=1 Tax=Plectropomus leopardus TaxID=160734 RepID=UPI001C4BEC03
MSASEQHHNQHHISIMSASEQHQSSIMSASEQHHISIMSASEQHHISIISASEQHHSSIIAAPKLLLADYLTGTVAVALRNQKVTISGGNGQVTEVSTSVSIPPLTHLTLCFELERSRHKQKEWIFTYSDSSSGVALSLGSDQSGMKMIVDGVTCPIDSIISSSDFTSTMKPFCFLWTSSNGRVAVYFNRNYWAKTCSSSTGHSVPAGGRFRLG